MSSSSVRVFLALALPLLASAAGPTSIFINQVPEYELLETCAENELSTIVRNMKYGCGDGSRTTSYACFCYESSAKFSSMIGAHVSSACSEAPSQNSSAIDVFSKYCQLGVVGPVEPTTTSSFSSTFSTAISSTETQTSSASPGSSPANPSSTPTSSPAAGSQEQQPPPPAKKDHTTAIAAGVSVPLGVLLLAAAAFISYKKKYPPETASELAATEAADAKHDVEVHEVSSDPKPRELDVPPTELPALGAKSELYNNQR